jgi:hypothetical protein
VPLSAPMDRNMILEHLEQARRHVVLGERHIARQREIIAELEGDDRDSWRARVLLATFEDLQKLHIADRNRLETELADSSK